MPKIDDAYSFSNIAANGTTTVKSEPGVLHTITINTKGVASNTCTVYDNTAASGTKIATIDTTGANMGAIFYDAQFKKGLTVVLATGTSADITVTYQ